MTSTTAGAEPVPHVPAAGVRLIRRILARPSAAVGLIGVVLLIGVALAGSAVAPYDFSKPDYDHVLAGPGAGHLLGTDQFGRDLLSRIILGARVSLLVGLSTTLLGGGVGVVIGLLCGYLGGWTDEILMRLMDVILSFPLVILAIGIAAIVGPSLQNVVGIISLLLVPQFARVARGSSADIRQSDYVVAARTMGRGGAWIVYRHVLPNTLGPIVVLASLTVPTAIISESALSFLGLGVDPTSTPSWGSILSDGKGYLLQDPYFATFAGLAITLAVLLFNLLGDGIRDAIDTRTGA